MVGIPPTITFFSFFQIVIEAGSRFAPANQRLSLSFDFLGNLQAPAYQDTREPAGSPRAFEGARYATLNQNSTAPSAR